MFIIKSIFSCQFVQLPTVDVRMLSLRANTRPQIFPPLVDSRVYIPPLMQIMPDFDQFLLQFINTVHPCLVHALLHDTPNLVIHILSVKIIMR